MEVGLVAAYSADAGFRAQADSMAGALVDIPGAAGESFDSPALSLRLRIAPWAGEAVASNPSTGNCLAVMGVAWDGPRRCGAAGLLRAFETQGSGAFSGLGGSFAILIRDEGDKRLLLVTDRLATKKIYLHPCATGVLCATELAALMAHPAAPRAIDEAAVTQLLVTSHLLDERSLVRDVGTLPPASITTITAGGIDTRIYWQPRIVPGPDDGLDPWADRLAETLSAAVKSRCGEGPLILPLSGGLDSRTIAAFVPPERLRETQSCSFGHAHCYDVRYGRTVARALGTPFRFIPLPDTFFRDDLEPMQRLTDGEVSIEALPVHHLLAVGEPGATLLTGYLGDALSGAHLLGLNECPDHPSRLERMWQGLYRRSGFSRAQLARVLDPQRHHMADHPLPQLMASALDNADGPTWDERELLVELYHRQSRYISYLGRMVSSRFRGENPFLDTDVMDVFLTLPLAHRRDQRAYRRMLVRHAPRLASVPEVRTHWPITRTDRLGSPARARPIPAVGTRPWLPGGVAWRVSRVRRVAGALLSRMSGGWLGPHNRDYYVHHDESIRTVDPDWFRAKLTQNDLTNGWFKADALMGMLDEHLQCKADHAIRINNVVAFLEWRRLSGL